MNFRDRLYYLLFVKMKLKLGSKPIMLPNYRLKFKLLARLINNWRKKILFPIPDKELYLFGSVLSKSNDEFVRPCFPFGYVK